MTKPVVPTSTASSPCGAQAFDHLIGTTLARDATFPDGTRVIRPRMAITMDHRTDRLNITIDDNRRVIRVHCG